MSDRIKYLARVKVETATPLGVGSGEVGLVNDRLVAKDANYLPYIPGTSLAGVVRHEMESRSAFAADITRLFGYQVEDKGQGSRLAFSSGILLAEDNTTVLEGLQQVDKSKGYYSFFKRLPERDHVRINDRGAAVKHGKFEEELVHKGTRFVFEIELDGSSDDQEAWDTLLAVLHHPTFRIGAGTRKGFGQLDIIECTERIYDLHEEKDLDAYLNRSSSLNGTIEGGKFYAKEEKTAVLDGWYTYNVELEPENFFLFGSGIFQEDIHNAPKVESYFMWTEDGPKLSEPKLLIPATSVKGAISHRLAYHYNRLQGVTIEQSGTPDFPELQAFDLERALAKFNLGLPVEKLNFSEDSPEWKILENKIDQMSLDDSEEWKEYLEQLDELNRDDDVTSLPVGQQNKAVTDVFGYAKDSKGKQKGARGKAIFSDIYLEKKEAQLKVLNHVAIDRFTGGAIDGALFQEQVVAGDKFSFQIYIEKDAFTDPIVKQAFEHTLEDLVEGRLQLGGNTTKGHGVFLRTKSSKKSLKEGQEV